MDSASGSYKVKVSADTMEKWDSSSIMDILVRALDSSVSSQGRFQKGDLSCTKMEISSSNILSGTVPGHDELSLKWAIEFARLDGDEPVLCVKVLDIDGKTVLSVGPVVALYIGGRGLISVILEDHVQEKWVKLLFPAKQYDSSLNLEWLAKGEISVISMGFFHKSLTAEKFIRGNIGILSSDLVYGFQFVRHCIQKNNENCFPPPSWTVHHMMESSGLLEVDPTTEIDPSLVFRPKFDLAAVRRWCVGKKWIAEKEKASEEGDTNATTAATAAPKRKRNQKAVSVEEPEAKKPAAPRKRIAKEKPLALTIPDVQTASDSGKKKRAEKSKKMVVPASTTSISLHPEDDIDEHEAPEENKVLEGREVLKQMEKFYTFGINEIFNIPVESILPAPARLCYRMLNREHVQGVAMSMITNPGHEPHVADLIPYSQSRKSLLHFENTEADKKDFIAAMKKKEIQFLAISGQHSARAARWIIEWSKKDAKLSGLADKLRFRKSRILSDRTPTTILAEHSSRSNAINATMEFKSCFLDTVVHARRQFDECGRPDRPVPGEHKRIVDHQRFQDWLTLAKITMGKSQIKNVFWLLFASDELFELWRRVCQEWVNGVLPDGAGDIGRPKPAKQITVANFRCFEGDIEESEIISVLNSVLAKKCLLKKDSTLKSAMPSMEDMAKDIKILRKLKQIVIEYFNQKDSKVFPQSTSWDQLVEKIPALNTREELERCRRAAGEIFLNNLLKRNLSKESCPSTLVIRLDFLYSTVFGGETRQRSQPYVVFFSDNLMRTMTPESLDERPPSCPLAIVDFSRHNQRLWTDSEIYVLFQYISELPQNATVVVVITVHPGELAANVLSALHRISRDKKISVHTEYGSYFREGQPHPSGSFWNEGIEEVIFAGLSVEENFNWQQVFQPLSLKPRWSFDEAKDRDFCVQPKARKEKAQGKEKEIVAEGEKRKENSEEIKAREFTAEELKNILETAPTFEMVGDQGGFVNQHAKPRRMIQKIVKTLSEPGDTVLDFFSGGQVMKASFLLKRECFVYTDTEREKNFVQAYAEMLYQNVPSVKRYFESVNLVGRECIALDGNIAVNDEELFPAVALENVLVCTPEEEDFPEENYATALDERATQGGVIETYEDDNVSPAPIPGSAFDYPMENVIQTFNENGKGTLVLVENVIDVQPLDSRGQGEADEANQTSDDNPLCGESSNQGHVAAVLELEVQAVAEEGEIQDHTPAIAEDVVVAVDQLAASGASKQAGAATSSSPLFCASDNKLVFVTSDGSPIILPFSNKVGKSVGRTGYTKLDAICKHYIWKSGYLKGHRVSLQDGAKIMAQKEYFHGPGRLTPVWGSPYSVPEDVSIVNSEIQSELEIFEEVDPDATLGRIGTGSNLDIKDNLRLQDAGSTSIAVADNFQGSRLEKSPNVLAKRKLLLLDLNGLLWNSERQMRHAPTTSAEAGTSRVHLHQIFNVTYKYTERPGLHEFLSLCFERFDVAIWTCASSVRTMQMVNFIFTEEERRNFKFVFHQHHTIQTRVRRQDISGVDYVRLKDFRIIWKHFGGCYDASNTILIDDSPIKAFVNPQISGLYPNTFRHIDGEEDNFLLTILWPCLERLSKATHVCLYLNGNSPKWSLHNIELDMRWKWEEYAELKQQWTHQVMNRIEFNFTALDVTEDEVTWDQKYAISKLPTLEGVSKLNDIQVSNFLRGLYRVDYEGWYRHNKRQYLIDLIKARDVDKRFGKYMRRWLCNRDIIVDRDGKLLTCSNTYCKEH